jgi:hypothetical protein
MHFDIHDSIFTLFGMLCGFVVMRLQGTEVHVTTAVI